VSGGSQSASGGSRVNGPNVTASEGGGVLPTLQRQNRLMEVVRVHRTPRGCQAAYVKQRAAWIAPGSSVLTQLVGLLLWEPFCG
jgi:hypothetical protein